MRAKRTQPGRRSQHDGGTARAAPQSIEARSSSRRFPGGDSAFVRAQRLGHTVGASTTVRPSGAAAVVQRDSYRVRGQGSPPYGWLPRLAAHLDTTAGAGNWGFSGSFAMYCWAWIKDGEARTPDDIDILVAPERVGAVVTGLYRRFDIPKNYRGLNEEHLKIENTAVDVVAFDKDETKFATSIDVLAAGGRFGDITDIVPVELDDGPTLPLLTVKGLIKSKEEASFFARMEAAAKEEETGKRPPPTKAEKDLALLEKLKD